jgi:lipopolysaccharide biosynthesis protein
MANWFRSVKKSIKKRQAKAQQAEDAAIGQAYDPLAHVLERHDGHVAAGSQPMLCLMAHFDPDGWIDPYVQYAIKQYADLGAEVVLVSTSPSLNPEHLAQVLPYVRMVVRRDNRGIDFGSWRTAMALIENWSYYERVLITNDSIYGPLFPLAPVFEAMASHPLWGMTDNWEMAFHVQSYFWVFQQPVLSSAAMQDFWHNFCFYQDKSRIIKHYEVGFTPYWIKQGVYPVAYAPYRQVRQQALAAQPDHPDRWLIERNIPLNQTHSFWDFLIEQRQFPFLKRDLLNTNVTKRQGIYRWDEVIEQAGSSYPIELIENHLKRFARKQAV